MPGLSLALLLAGVILGGLVAGVLLTLGLTGGSLRCMIRGHQRSSDIWTSRDSAGVGYSCPRCGVLWLPSNPLDRLSP